MGHKRTVDEKKKLKKLYEQTKNEWGNGAYFNEKKQRLVRYSATESGTGKYLRRIANKKVRNKQDLPLKGAMYRRVYDYWWTLF